MGSRIDNRKLEHRLSRIGDMALKRRAEFVVREAAIEPGQSVLDCGCGDGFFVHLLADVYSTADIRFVGVDLDRRALDEAHKRLPGILLVHGNLAHLPLPGQAFDRAIVCEVLEHVLDDLAALREIVRVVQPGGLIVITVPHFDYPMFWDPPNKILQSVLDTHMVAGFWAGIWNQHLRLYRREELIRLTQAAGLTVESLHVFTRYCLPFNHHLMNAAARLLYDGHMPQEIAAAMSKYDTISHRPAWLRFAFWFVNTIDRLNEQSFDTGSGASLVLKARVSA